MQDWLSRALEESRARGYLGPGSIEPQIAHAREFAAAWGSVEDRPPGQFLDLGSGGGLPGLVLLTLWDGPGVLTDSMQKRTTFLREVLQWENAPTRASVATGRVEELSRIPEYDGAFALVTARSFGPPSVTAECSVRFLKLGGVLLVSEPPDPQRSIDRWPAGELVRFGLEAVHVHRESTGIQILRKVAPTDPLFPRKSGIPAKRPLF